ncbi:hypothetical protein KIN20_020309 [Parelaphostrongylus tenuis]|uniref:Uncharacterized protein n=1 Tax=Parelaphostrongylus tenuis TaxID=148309 RepID=A0AAD5MM88_PARTN|nr:hypothetical protein KIN20_020309 [Parelaphostrongylus tenuis]
MPMQEDSTQPATKAKTTMRQTTVVDNRLELSPLKKAKRVQPWVDHFIRRADDRREEQ